MKKIGLLLLTVFISALSLVVFAAGTPTGGVSNQDPPCYAQAQQAAQQQGLGQIRLLDFNQVLGEVDYADGMGNVLSFDTENNCAPIDEDGPTE